MREKIQRDYKIALKNVNVVNYFLDELFWKNTWNSI